MRSRAVCHFIHARHVFIDLTSSVLELVASSCERPSRLATRNTMPLESTERPIACDLNQIPPELRERLERDFQRIFGRATALRALPDGFALEFSNQDGTVAGLGEIIEY